MTALFAVQWTDTPRGAQPLFRPPRPRFSPVTPVAERLDQFIGGERPGLSTETLPEPDGRPPAQRDVLAPPAGTAASSRTAAAARAAAAALRSWSSCAEAVEPS